ncbi:MAG: hypothetical protein R3F49_17780 [Planctomycetota bacterium]
MIDTLEDLGIAQQDDAEDGYSKPVSLVDMPVYECLSKEEQTLARTFGAKAAMRTPSWLSSYSHENIGWKLAWDAGLGAQRPAVRVDLRIGMQQLLDRDPWLDEAPDADLAELLRSSDTDMGSPW